MPRCFQLVALLHMETVLSLQLLLISIIALFNLRESSKSLVHCNQLFLNTKLLNKVCNNGQVLFFLLFQPFALQMLQKSIVLKIDSVISACRKPFLWLFQCQRQTGYQEWSNLFQQHQQTEQLDDGLLLECQIFYTTSLG